MKVFVVNQDGQPLMPTTPRQARLLLKSRSARIYRRRPFTIQLLYHTSGYVQDVTLGIDSGYENIGVSAVTAKEEVVSVEVKLLTGMSERLKARAMYRRQRRQYHTRYRQSRFDNRRKNQGWLAPSIQHKLDTHIRVIEMYKRVLPVKTVIIEVANFDIQAIKNPSIAGVSYQNGEQAGFWNLREYILHRDGHKCQNPNCANKTSPVLEVHHIGYWKPDRTDRPGNLLTLCDKCHTPKNHQPGGFLHGWEPKLKGYKSETFMASVRWRLVNAVNAIHTYGHITKSARIGLHLEKSHRTDAFVIACGTTQPRAIPYVIEQRRRNNRSLETFKDAQYIDLRTGEKATGTELASGRRKRGAHGAKNLFGENLRQYRGQKVRDGKRAIRRQRYALRPGDAVLYEKKNRIVVGVHSYGQQVFLQDDQKGKISVPTKKVQCINHSAGLCPVVLR